MKMFYEIKNHKHLDKVALIESKIKSEKRKYEKSLKCSEDTIIRTEIHGIIKGAVSKGQTKKEIIDTLANNERYTKYQMYFENWIEDRIKKESKISERENKIR